MRQTHRYIQRVSGICGTASLTVLIATATIFLCLSYGVRAQQSPVDSRAIRDRELDRLIDSLANHNEPPKLVANTALFSEKYDWAEQRRVIRAIDVLVREKNRADDVWPQLVKHIGDERYSLTCEFNGGVGNRTVGSICWNIAYDDLMVPFNGCWPNKSEIPNIISPHGDLIFPPPHQDIKGWYHARQDKPLWQLQVEVGEWAITAMEGLRETTDESPWKTWAIPKTKKVIDQLRKTKQPIVRKLPWSFDTKFFDAQEAREIREAYRKRKE